MTTRTNLLIRLLLWIVWAAVFLAFAAGVVVLLLWLAGKFSPKVPTEGAAARTQASKFEGRLVPVRLVSQPMSESAVGTIRAVHETSIGSKLLARVVEVNLKADQKVRAGDVLIRLDDTDLRAKLRQAQAAVASAEAVFGQAAADEKRYAPLVKSRTISQQQYDGTVAARQSAEADLHRAQAAVHEVQATLDWATVRSPGDGTVIDKRVDVGDMVTPGQILVTLFDPTHMQLVASVRESLRNRLQVGQSVGVEVKGLDKQCSGTVSEIVPESQAASRSFQVKVTGPCPAGIYSGMFGRVVIPLQEEKVLAIPRRAVRNVGQLELVQVAENGRAASRAIRTGRELKEPVEFLAGVREKAVEVLSGLRQGEQVVLPPASEAMQEAPRE
jgi:RND family efflux transporter MFP subunit